MKKIILIAAITASTTFALDMKSIGSVGSALGLNADTLGTKLYDVVKTKAPKTAEQAKSLCNQASTYKSFVGIAEDGMMAKAIDICAQKASKGLEGQVKDKVSSAVTKEAGSASNIISNVLGK